MNKTIHPNFFLVGAPKSGTTAMATYLRQHPQIFIPELKEPHFFCSDLEFRRNFARGPEWFRPTAAQYQKLYSPIRDEPRSGDSSVLYLYSHNAPYEIKEFCPDADIIVMLRNPVDMAYSLHGHWLYILNEDIADFGLALAAEPQRKRGFQIPPKAYFADGLQYREMSSFSEHVRRYFDVFGREKVQIIIFDDFKDNTAPVYRETLRFLGVADDFEPEFEVINPSMRVRSRILQHFIINPPSIARLMLRPLVNNLRTRRWLERAAQFINVRRVPRPPMAPEVREVLRRDLAPEVEKLSDLLDRDLTQWSET